MSVARQAYLERKWPDLEGEDYTPSHLPPFYGDDSIDTISAMHFFNRCSAMGREYGWTGLRKVQELERALRGRALRWFNDTNLHGRYHWEGWPALVDEFSKEFLHKDMLNKEGIPEQKALAVRPQPRRAPLECFYCLREGHKQDFCFQRARDGLAGPNNRRPGDRPQPRRQPPKCFYCLEEGHKQDLCFKRAKDRALPVDKTGRPYVLRLVESEGGLLCHEKFHVD